MQVKPHSPTDSIAKAVERAREAGIDVLVSAGGGSAIDTAKGVAALLAEGGSLPRFGVRFTPPNKKEVPPMPAPKLPHIAIPTTLVGRGVQLFGGHQRRRQKVYRRRP